MGQGQQVPSLTDERLCWLAVRDRLGKKARRVGPFGWLLALTAASGGRQGGTAAGIAGDMRREGSSGRMHDYAFAVDAASERLSAEERGRLRATGEVPEWFLADVERRAAESRKRR
ncbi:hypothetical protein AB0K51_03265 [Kitasatospora sp. NPDC049285]|uniref:hypothetical protein n=1 Tax=Kitasatospora sp. NPDC049285 TaxID=3157096 RepID=UPI00344A70C8